MSISDLLAFAVGASRLPTVLTCRGCTANTDRWPAGTFYSPVLLLHGYAGTDVIWDPLRAALRAAGFGHVLRLSYNSLSTDVDELAESVVAHARSSMDRTGVDTVHLVGHSLGGLLARYVALSEALRLHVRTVVTIATPHHGVPLARLAPGPCARLMRPGSPLLTALSSRPAPPNTRWVSYFSDADWIVPISSSRLTDEALRATNVEVSRAGHFTVCADREVVAGVVAQLRLSEVTPALERGPATNVAGSPTPSDLVAAAWGASASSSSAECCLGVSGRPTAHTPRSVGAGGGRRLRRPEQGRYPARLRAGSRAAVEATATAGHGHVSPTPAVPGASGAPGNVPTRAVGLSPAPGPRLATTPLGV